MLKVFSSLGCALFLFWSFAIADARASEPLFFNASLPKNSFQLARSTFLPDKADDLGLSDFDSIDADFSDDNCAAYPYSACPEGATCEACPLDMSKYRIKSCQAPYLQSGDNCVCPPAVELSNPNDECTQYCGTTCISKKCTSSPSQSSCTVGVKNCDDGCGFMTRYCCMDCKDTITTKPENSSFTYSSCKDGTGTHDIKTGWTCNSGFHENQGVCEKNCISNNCSGYTLPSCPSHATCSKCTVTSGDCSSGDTKYKINSCDSGYKISGGSCVPAEASVGDILFSDMTTSPELVSGKTPIGIVFDPSRKIAMSLTHSDIIRFVEEDDSTVGYISQLRDNDISGYKTYTPPYESGQSNTSILLDFGESKNLHFSAAKYCNNYTTPGTAAGSWFLPSHYEVIYPLQTYEDKISAAYNLVGEKSIIYSRYWTSSIDNSLKSSIRMDGNYSFYQPYGEPIPSHIDDPTSNYFWRSYAYCGINYGKKSCSVQTCSTYTLSSCPSHGICSTCTIRDENCNTGSNKYKLDSCETGYVLQGNSCSRLILPLPILYSDLTTSYELFPNKTAIGVVFDTELKRAVSLVKHKEK